MFSMKTKTRSKEMAVSIDQLTDFFKSMKISQFSKLLMPKDLSSFLAWEHGDALDWITRYEHIGVGSRCIDDDWPNICTWLSVKTPLWLWRQKKTRIGGR